MHCILIDAHLSDGHQLAMHDVFPLRGIDLFKLSTLHMSLHTTHVPPHYTCSSTLHMFLHTTHVPPHYTCPSTLHMSLHTTHVPPHYTCSSTLHMSLHTTHVPPHSLCFALFLIHMRKLVLMCAWNTCIQTSLCCVLQ